MVLFQLLSVQMWYYFFFLQTDFILGIFLRHVSSHLSYLLLSASMVAICGGMLRDSSLYSITTGLVPARDLFQTRTECW